MGPTQWNSRLSLFLLLGLLGMAILVHAPPPGISRAQWFVIQHINMTNKLCNIAMQAINRYNFFPGICKGQNTFLRTSLSSVTPVCRNKNVTCSDRLHTNCHRSRSRVNIIHCNLTRRAQNYRLCQYQQTRGRKNYNVACNNYYHPVHLDRVY
ncbi:non-secretory ribonuclease-like [Phyllostomus discolor]|uniref:Non-secretory ribonuclease-like n=1 Tax=Phyllostomus discolor TaxID=89673 RepID=A0A6J2KZG3_9CHIR|nr:non-secretory ribonuclease-like [Phyllostomus discolor]